MKGSVFSVYYLSWFESFYQKIAKVQSKTDFLFLVELKRKQIQILWAIKT